MRGKVLVCSTGLTLEHDKIWMLRHRATTHGGFSGFPVFRGSGVVGLHIGCNVNTNEMIRIETIAALLPKPETPTVYIDPYYEGSRSMAGALQKMARHFDFDIGVDREGRISFKLWNKSKGVSLRTQDLEEDPEAYEDIPISNPAAFMGLESGEDKVFPSKTHEQMLMEEDLNDSYHYTSVPPSQEGKTKVVKKRKKKSNRKESGLEILPPSGVVHMDKLTRMSVPKVREENPFMVSLFKDENTALEVLGYDKDKFEWPQLTALGEKVSLEKHLELFQRRNVALVPEHRKPKLRVRKLLRKICQDLVFEAPIAYKSKENIEAIINSSDVKDSKSPGYPYAADGMANNKTVIARHGGAPGCADLVLQKWDTKSILRVFNKGEPHSRKKILSKMLRIIAGFPLDTTIQNVALFKNFKDKVNSEWLTNPIKFNWSPLVVGANKHLKEWLGDGPKWSSDKSNWDFNMFEKHFIYCRDLILDLVVKPHGMTQEEFDEYRNDVKKAFDDVMSAEYVTSDGSHYKALLKGIMRSGWYLTIICNSIAQLAHHIETCVELGMSDEDIIKAVIVVGGDDVLQNALACGKEAYIRASKKLGVELEIEETPSFEGCEFFSHRLYTTQYGVSAIPQRFTKHIENLKRTTLGTEADSLASKLAEWAWDDDKFEFFRGLYMKCRESDPGNFPLKLLHNKEVLRMHYSGVEVAA